MVSRLRLYEVESSMIQAAGYDPDAHVLEIVFHNGRTRQYLAVPPEVFSALLSAPSPGSYFMKRIRHVYEHQSVLRTSL